MGCNGSKQDPLALCIFGQPDDTSEASKDRPQAAPTPETSRARRPRTVDPTPSVSPVMSSTDVGENVDAVPAVMAIYSLSSVARANLAPPQPQPQPEQHQSPPGQPVPAISHHQQLQADPAGQNAAQVPHPPPQARSQLPPQVPDRQHSVSAPRRHHVRLSEGAGTPSRRPEVRRTQSLHASQMDDPGPEGPAVAGKEGVDSFFDVLPPTPASRHISTDDPGDVLKATRGKMECSLAQMLARVEELDGDVDQALEEEGQRAQRERNKEEQLRDKVMGRFLATMGPSGPGLRVKKYHRAGGKGERGKWASRVLKYVPEEDSDAEEDRSPVPRRGTICWGSRRLFAKEGASVQVSDIIKVETSGKFVWVNTASEERLCFETRQGGDAKFLCRAMEYLIEALYDQDDDGSVALSYSEAADEELERIDIDVPVAILRQASYRPKPVITKLLDDPLDYVIQPRQMSPKA